MAGGIFFAFSSFFKLLLSPDGRLMDTTGIVLSFLFGLAPS
jgi:hypothetical protein